MHRSRLTLLLVRVLPYLLVGGVALWLRVADLGVFISGDEADFWIPRSERFLHALQTGNFNDMPVLGHPGVTTMWLGSAGIALRRALFEQGIVQTETFQTILALHRLPAALVHVVGVLAGYALLRRLLAPVTALLAALLWAADPFVIAFSRVLHVDALAGTFATLCLLAACVAWQDPPTLQSQSHPHRRWLMVGLSGACAGLAVLSKSPALTVGPVVGTLALAAAYREYRTLSSPQLVGRAMFRVLLPLLVWGIVFATTLVALWPAVWSDPARVYALLQAGVETEATSPHMLGNFFLGRSVDAPGPLFYPVALALRTTPWVLVGLLLLPFACVPRRTPPPPVPHSPHPIVDPRYRTLIVLVVLAGYVILFTVAMSIFPKKFNRYLVPAFPAVDVLAAMGIAWLSHVLVTITGGTGGAGLVRLAGYAGWRVGAVRLVLPVVVGIAAVVNAVWWHPYGIAAFNQALGGAQAGARTFVVGWGEGYAQAAAWLNQQPDITDVVTLSQWGSSLNPYLRAGAQANSADNGSIPDSTGYVVVYVRHVQGTPPPPPYSRFYGHATPLHVVTIHGVGYAWIYAAPRPIAHRTAVDFGASLRLSGYDTDTSAVRGSGVLTVTTQWHVRAPLPDSESNSPMLFLHVLDERGATVGAVDVPPGGPHAPVTTWDVGRYATWAHPVPVPPDIPAGTYYVSLGLYDPQTFERVPLTGGSGSVPGVPASAPDDGEHALLLAPVVVP